MSIIKRHVGPIKLVLMVILSCAIQVVSLMKSSLVAGIFGASATMDAFNVANSLTTFIFSFAIAGISTIVIPCYVKQQSRKQMDAFLTVVFTGIFVICALSVLFRAPLISLITGRDAEFVALSGDILIVLLISNLFSIFTSVTSAYFQYAGKYNLPKIITLISQILIVILLAYSKEITVLQYALIIGMGLVVNTVLDVYFALKSGWRYAPTFCVNDPKTKRLFYSFFPIIFSTGVYQLSLMIDSSIASRLNAGDVTLLNYASQISSMINTLLVSNLLTYIYPKLVKDIETQREQQTFWKKTYAFHAIICLVVTGYFIVGRDGVSLLYEHGKFDSGAGNTVFWLGLIYLAAQPVNIVRDLIYRYFYSDGDTKSTTLNSVVATVVNVFSSLLFVNFWGLSGIVIGTSFSSLTSLITIMIRFGRKYGYEKKLREILCQYAKNILISIATIFATLLAKKVCPLEGELGSILVYGMCTVFVYTILTMLFNRKIIKTALHI